MACKSQDGSTGYLAIHRGGYEQEYGALNIAWRQDCCKSICSDLPGDCSPPLQKIFPRKIWSRWGLCLRKRRSGLIKKISLHSSPLASQSLVCTLASISKPRIQHTQIIYGGCSELMGKYLEANCCCGWDAGCFNVHDPVATHDNPINR